MLIWFIVGVCVGALLALSAEALITIAVTVLLAAIAGVCGLARYWWRATEPGRTYAVGFGGRKTADAKKNREGLVELRVTVEAKKPVITSMHSFRLVTRHLSPRINRIWRWEDAPTDTVAVCRIWDAELEQRRQTAKKSGNPFGGGPERFTASMVRDGCWVAEYPLRAVATQSSFEYRVIIKIHSREIWRGFLEFSGGGKDGRMSRTQRGVTLWP